MSELTTGVPSMQDYSRQPQGAEDDVKPLTSSEQQAANAAGENGNEQGQASFITGSTTGGGSNYGQGSHQLGGKSYRQGDKVNPGSNYSNEAGKLGASSTGTSSEGSSSRLTGAAASGYNGQDTGGAGDDARSADGGTSADEARGRESNPEDLEEGNRRDTGLEKDSGLADNDDNGAVRHASGSWSHSTVGNND